MPRIRLVLVLFAVGALLAAPFAHGATSNVVVSQIFAGGGNAGATYTNDFVELFNRGAAAVNVTGWTVQYASGARRAGRRRRSRARSAPVATTSCNSHRPRRSGRLCRRPMRRERRTSRPQAARSRSYATRSRSRAAQRPEAVPPLRSSRISSATAPQPTSRGRSRAGTRQHDCSAAGRRRLHRHQRERDGLRGRSTGSAERALTVCVLLDRGATEPVGERSRRCGRAAGDLAFARAVEPQLRERRRGKHAAADLREGDRGEQRHAGYSLTVHRSAFVPNDLPLGIAAPAGWTARLDSDLAGSRSPDRELPGRECARGRHLADGHRLRLGRACRRARSLHRDADLHGDRAVIAAAAGLAAALSVSPVHIRLTRAASRTITITNAGNASANVEARPAGFVLDRRGKPMIARERQPTAGWLRLQPPRLVSHRVERPQSRSRRQRRRGALPGDHAALVLLTTQPPRGAGVTIRMRIGVVVFVRVAGRIVHRLELGALRVRRHALELVVANRGNVVETRVCESPYCAAVTCSPDSGLSGARCCRTRAGIERFHRSRRLRGWVTARVEVGALRRIFRLRL